MGNMEIIWVVKIANIEVILKIRVINMEITWVVKKVYEHLRIQMKIWFMNGLLSFVTCQKVKISCCMTNNYYSGYTEESVGSSYVKCQKVKISCCITIKLVNWFY